MAAIDTHDLLNVLRTLFKYAARMNLEQRLNIHTHKPDTVSVDISDRLNQQIDKLSTATRKDRAITASQAVAAADGTNSVPISSSRKKIKSIKIDEKNSLSEHLQTCRNLSYSDSYMGKRLQRSAQNHIYTSLFYARNGDNQLAKLHSNIAVQAMKEVHQYLNDDEYIEFSRYIESVLSE